jgi:membrane fusion protein (multidrug efflux system)
MDTTQEKQAEKPAASPPPKNNGKRNRLLKWVLLAIVLVLFIWFLLWFFYLRFHESTDDAYVNGSLINVNAVISGNASAFYADDTDLVVEGQLLVMIDPTDYQILYDLQKANLAATVLQVRQLYDLVEENKANLEIKQTLLEKARFDHQNRSQLIKSGAVSNEDFVHSRDDLRTAELEVELAQQQLKASESLVGKTTLESHPQVEVAKENLRQAYYNLHHCMIYAPYTGYVAQRSVNVGQRVAPDTPLMAIIPLEGMWVDANFKETQLRQMRVGQPTSVTIDLYGSKVNFEGTVLGIAFGTGSVFSLIPPQNATGNWIKIVQRLPVRISLNPEVIKKHPLRLGLSAYVDVNLTNTSLPMVATEPVKKVVEATYVYQLDFEEIDKLIAQIIKDNSN